MSSYTSELLWGNIDLICLFVLPIIIITVVLWICKKYNFSILPKNMKGKKNRKFKIPNLKRVRTDRGLQWDIADDEDFYEDDVSNDENMKWNSRSYFGGRSNTGKNIYD